MLIQNAIQTPDGTILVSRHRHDMQSHIDKDGSRYAVDGCSDYCKITGDKSKIRQLFISHEECMDDMVDWLVWGTRPNPKDGKVVYRFLKDLETEHLKAIAKTQKPTIWILMSIFYILNERKELYND